jgi:hypothetical protein
VSKVYHYTLATRPVIDPLSRLYSAHVFYEVRPGAFKTRPGGYTSVATSLAKTERMQPILRNMLGINKHITYCPSKNRVPERVRKSAGLIFQWCKWGGAEVSHRSQSVSRPVTFSPNLCSRDKSAAGRLFDHETLLQEALVQSQHCATRCQNILPLSVRFEGVGHGCCGCAALCQRFDGLDGRNGGI